MPAEVSTGHTAKLNGREQIAAGTMAFHFDRPHGFEFRAAQAVDITLLDPNETDAEGNIRTFSIASPPFEDQLTIATRMRDSAFKRVLKSMPLGTAVHIDGPSGSLTLHKNSSKPAVFLAGDIGITPFLSMLRQAAYEKLPHQLFLFYSNRRPEDACFLETLNELQRTNPNFRFVPTMTEIGESHLIGQNGMDVIRNIKRMYSQGDGHVLVLAASIRNLEHLLYCLQLETELVTVPAKVLDWWASKNFPMPDKQFQYEAPGRVPRVRCNASLTQLSSCSPGRIPPAGVREPWLRRCASPRRWIGTWSLEKSLLRLFLRHRRWPPRRTRARPSGNRRFGSYRYRQVRSRWHEPSRLDRPAAPLEIESC